MEKVGQGDQFQTSFCFLKKLHLRPTQVVSNLVFTYIGKLLLAHTIRTIFITFQTCDPKIYSIVIFNEGLRVVSLPNHILCMISHVIFY